MKNSLMKYILLSQGKITVQFMDLSIDLQDFSRKNVYEMVETAAYFEAYNPILQGLQQTKESDLPFQVSTENAISTRLLRVSVLVTKF